MQHVLGLSSNYDPSPLGPLDRDLRIRFSSDHSQSFGYFELISPSFDRYARRDCDSGIESQNVMFCLAGDDLLDALKILRETRNELSSYPNSWRTFLGTIQRPGQAPLRIEPLLFRSRALSLVGHLEHIAAQATRQNKRIVYGSGVAYRHLCGIKLSPGTVEYS